MAAREDRLDSTVAGRTITRSISLPVQECLSLPWNEFLRLLHDSWRQSTCLANWASQMLARNDVVRTPGMAELPPMPAVDLYALAFGRAREGKGKEFWKCSECNRKWHLSQTNGGAAPAHQRGKEPCPGAGRLAAVQPRKELPAVEPVYDGGDFWAGSKVAAATLLRKVAAKYAKERGKVVWRRERRTPEYLYPYPFPVHQQAWEVVFDERNRPVVLMGLPGGRVSVRLRGGDEFRRQLKILHKIEEGDFPAIRKQV